MTSTNPNLIFVAVPNRGSGQHQRKDSALDRGWNRIERKNNFRNDDALDFPVRGSMLGCEGKSNAASDFFDVREFRGEGIEHMARLDYRDFGCPVAHRPLSAPETTLTKGYLVSRCECENRAAIGRTWLTGSSSYEELLEEGMEQSFGRIVDGATEGNKRNNPRRAANDTDHECESDKRDQLRVANFTSNANRISNRCTIFPASSPIAAAGASVSPNGSATNSFSSSRGGVESRHARTLRSDTPEQVGELAEGQAFKRGGDVFALRGFANQAGVATGPRETNFPSGLCGFNELGRTSSPKPDNSAGLFPSKYIPPFFFSSMANVPTAVACLDNEQSSEGQSQNGYSATHKRAQNHVGVH